MQTIDAISQPLRGELKTPIQYTWTLNNVDYNLNTWLGKKLTILFHGKITCIHCQRPTKKSFNQGYCYPCFQKLARCALCVLKPETCHFHLGTCREPEWGLSHCMQSHIVYLANTSDLKVGITRANHVPNRWIDQGATQAIPFFSVHTRFQSGLIEDRMKTLLPDKTHWRKMLAGEAAPLDLMAERERLYPLVLEKIIPLHATFLTEATPITLKYPILEIPAKIQSVNPEKTPTIEGSLVGIKGQYLLFDTGQVLNIRNTTGYHIRLTI